MSASKTAAAAYAVGKECDAFCTKCKRDTLHNIVALDAKGLPAQVECRSCGGAHKYRAPKAAPAAAAAAPRATAARKTVGTAAKKGSKAAAPPAPAQVYKRWEDLLNKRAGVTAQAYSVTEAYGVEDVVEHTQFGLGFVTEATAWNRIKVIFQDAERVLISRHGQKPPA